MLKYIQRVSPKVLSSDIGKRMAYGAFWSMTGTALGKFLVLVSGIVCARILGKEVFGEFGMIRSTIGLFIVLGSAGIGITATRFISLYSSTLLSFLSVIVQLSADSGLTYIFSPSAHTTVLVR